MNAIIIILGILVIVALIFCFLFANKTREAIQQNVQMENRITELNKSVASLIRDSNIDVYMYDEIKKELYKFVDGDYKSAGFELDEIEDRIHPDDADQYLKDYSDVIYGRKDSVVSVIRIYNPSSKRFEEFEHIISPLKFDNDGKVIKYVYTKRNTTLQKEKDIERNKTMVNMHLALRGGDLMSWSYDTENKINKLILENNVEMEFHGDEFLQLLMPEEQDKFNLFISDLINHHPSEQQLCINLKLPNCESYIPFRIDRKSVV